MATDTLIQNMLAGDRLALARLISKIENRGEDRQEILEKLYPRTGRAQILGITGPPGAGKSTLVDQLTAKLRAQGKKVAIVAVDPSSPFSGGAILGDRIRMQRHTGDDGVVIRSLGTRGQHGGLSLATKEVIWVLDAAQFDVILVETAGVGQTELDILKVAQTVLVVLVPESGDSIQVMKAGLMEIADVFAVNKSDRPEADHLVRELVTMVNMSTVISTPSEQGSAARWTVPVLKTEANRDQGTTELLAALESHRHYLLSSGFLELKTRNLLIQEIFDILTEQVRISAQNAIQSASGKEILDLLIEKKIDPHQAAGMILSLQNK